MNPREQYPRFSKEAQRLNARRAIVSALINRTEEPRVLKILYKDATPKDLLETDVLVSECEALKVPIKILRDVVVRDEPNETGGQVIRGTVILLDIPAKNSSSNSGA